MTATTEGSGGAAIARSKATIDVCTACGARGTVVAIGWGRRLVCVDRFRCARVRSLADVTSDERLVETVATAMFEDYHEAPFDACVENRADWLSMALVAVRTITAYVKRPTEPKQSGSTGEVDR